MTTNKDREEVKTDEKNYSLRAKVFRLPHHTTSYNPRGLHASSCVCAATMKGDCYAYQGFGKDR